MRRAEGQGRSTIDDRRSTNDSLESANIPRHARLSGIDLDLSRFIVRASHDRARQSANKERTEASLSSHRSLDRRRGRGERRAMRSARGTTTIGELSRTGQSAGKR
jgi:hypothetical protein